MLLNKVLLCSVHRFLNQWGSKLVSLTNLLKAFHSSAQLLVLRRFSGTGFEY